MLNNIVIFVFGAIVPCAVSNAISLASLYIIIVNSLSNFIEGHLVEYLPR